MTLTVRQAKPNDAAQMCDLLNAIIAIGGTTAHRTAFDNARMQADYIAHPRSIACSVAEQDGVILGFQSLEWSDPNWGGADPLPSDWAVIASFVADGHQGKGIGKRLFDASLAAAREASVTAIDATIRKENAGGLAYYSGVGFVDYMERGAAWSKRYEVAGDDA